MIKQFFIFSCSAFILAGCTTTNTDVTPLLPEYPIIQVELLEPCKPLPKLDKKTYTQQESFDAIKVWVQMYYDCALKHQALSELLQEYK